MKQIAYPKLILLLVIAMVLAFFASLSMGNASISILQAISDFFRQEDSLHQTVVWNIRLPRVLLALLVGATLGMAGAAMQGFLRNPLAEPGILGVSSGAALGAVLVLYFGFAATAWFILPVAAIAGALIALVLVYLLAGFRSSILSLILAGVAINAIAGAMIAVALNFAPSLFALQEIIFWLMGSLANRNMNHVIIAAPFIILGWILLLGRYRFLNALTLGEQTATTLGFNAQYQRNLLLVGLALCVGAAVSVSGSIGFVGLVVPHLLRPLVGHQPGKLLLASALGGAFLVLSADMLVRLFDTARELKLGVVTSLLGGPFFLALILKTRSRWI